MPLSESQLAANALRYSMFAQTILTTEFQVAQITREQRFQADSAIHEDPPAQSLIVLDSLSRHRAADRLARPKKRKKRIDPGNPMKTKNNCTKQIPFDP